MGLRPAVAGATGRIACGVVKERAGTAAAKINARYFMVDQDVQLWSAKQNESVIVCPGAGKMIEVVFHLDG